MSAETVDVARMVRHRHTRLQGQLADRDVAAAVLLHGPHVAYATGLPVPGVDATHAGFHRDVAVVVAGEDRPHLFTDRPLEAAEVHLDAHLHDPVWPELDEGAVALGAILGELGVTGRVAVDELTGAMLRTGVPAGGPPADAGRLVAAARLIKSVDEVGCIDEAQRRNEEAMVPVREALVPGVTRRELVAVFWSALADLGTEANLIDPILQPMPRRRADGPRTTTGDVAFPVAQRDWTYAEGDLVWVDSGIDHLGYASDYGRTWVVGRPPSTEERDCHDRWQGVVAAAEAAIGPGATLGDVGRAAIAADDGEVPWLPHFYLAHGVGIESAEMPLIGTDLGSDFDDGFVLAEGMTLVLEPVIWRDGHGGYRSEEVTVVTGGGCRRLGGGQGYEPFGGP